MSQSHDDLHQMMAISGPLEIDLGVVLLCWGVMILILLWSGLAA